MSTVAQLKTRNSEHFDVLIVGAGISGIGSAYHLRDQCPGKSFVILEPLLFMVFGWSSSKTGTFLRAGTL